MSFDEIATETAYPGMLVLPQDRVEHLLLHRVLETGLSEVRFGHQFVSYTETSELEKTAGINARRFLRP